MERIRLLRFTAVLLVAVAAGCAGRNPVPAELMSQVRVHGMGDIRMWEADYAASLDANSLNWCDCSFLALSGGGANGAFGAGVLRGWTEAGTRPRFAVVTGISTGALIAPFAFAGPEYDAQLEKMYTTLKKSDIFCIGWLVDALFDTKPLAERLAKNVDGKLLKKIAEEHARGRRLYIGTTNLDARRLVVWDMGAIASSEHPRIALKLFRKVMLASASIPVAFPPQYFDVENGKKRYDEMHVDGGVVAPAFGYGRELFQSSPIARQLRARTCSFYLIRNGTMGEKPQPVPRATLDIAFQSFNTLMESQLLSSIYGLHDISERDGVTFNYTYIPEEKIGDGGTLEFDRKEMRRLFDLGREMVLSGTCWQRELPRRR